MISVQDVSHSFGDFPVLREISLELAEQRIALIGANGSGKSTFARTLNGLLVPRRGQVLVNGVSTRKDAARARRDVGFIFSDADHQIIMPTVAEDVALGLRGRGLPKEQVAAQVREILDRFGLGGHLDHSAHTLSGGQKQMLALASVLVTEPKILICDEPTTLLDLRNVSRFTKTVEGLSQQVILLTHHLDIVRDFDRAIVIDAGAVYFDGPPAAAIDAYRALILDDAEPAVTASRSTA